MVAVYPKRAEEMALFNEQLNECYSPSDVLDLISRYTLMLRMVSSCLMRIWETTKRMTEEQSRYERQLMFDHPGFGQLCTFAMQSASRMRSIDLTFSLLAVVKLDVPQGSRLVQTLLRAIQVNHQGVSAYLTLTVFAPILQSYPSYYDTLIIAIIRVRLEYNFFLAFLLISH